MTLIVIIVDGKFHCSFDGDLQQWMHARVFKVITLKQQTSISDLPLGDIIRTRPLKIFANVHSESEMTLALFCYDMVNPTTQRIEADMCLYQMEQYKKTRD